MNHSLLGINTRLLPRVVRFEKNSASAHWSFQEGVINEPMWWK